MKLETRVEELIFDLEHADEHEYVPTHARDALRAHAREQAIAEMRALPYISEATATEIFEELDKRTAALLLSWGIKDK